MGYEGPQNGVGAGHMLPIAQYGQYQAQVSSYPLPASSWHGVIPQYVMQPAPHMSQVEVRNKISTVFHRTLLCT